MRTIRILSVLVFMLISVAAADAQSKKGEKTVTYNATLHCASCQAKVEKNIPYEKGVKSLKVDLKANTITVTFREDKNTVEGIQKAIEKLNVPVTGVAGAEQKEKCDEADKCDKKCCPKAGGESNDKKK